ncbi:O-antigen ligase family protein [Thiohalobacter sp. IOR34]|uniref:O-antigen ligase family protein n=1 Tax=Thiohalobacter sp. IOR34 TaxID=3057176 RepID=UPI0025B16C59|nr:O-antigen ligase family protein [Thiohalobacter sp. IOR34]WJW75305.1 O-antigen ligase family protein [Thiohalobacter sp. IOR34]
MWLKGQRQARRVTADSGPSEALVGAAYDIGSQRHGLLFGIFCLWVLSLPFYRYSVVATYSIDNLLAPFLCLSAVFLPRLRDQAIVVRRVQILWAMLALYTLYGIAVLAKFAASPVFPREAVWNIVRDSFYFFAPALYIRDLRTLRIMKKLIVVVAVIGGLSAFLVALGVIRLPVERFAESRIGEGWLPKSIGLFSSYGDLSILYGFVAVLMVSHGREALGFLGSRVGKLGVWLALLLGLAGSQSRNMLFGTILALCAYWGWRRLQTATGKQRNAIIGLFLAGMVVLPGIMVAFGSDIVERISQMGGERAEHTAVERLESYSQALALLAVEPLGVSYETYRKWQPLIEHIHNMWLRLLLQGGPLAVAGVAGLIWLAFKGGSKQAAPPLLPVEPPLIIGAIVALFIAVEFYGGISSTMWLMLGTLISFNWVRMNSSTASPKDSAP